jgi:cytoskeletal protein RodZ
MRSVGRLLLSEREKKKLTLQEVYKIVKIHPKYLKALEEDNYSLFEGKVHAKGFLKVYAEFCLTWLYFSFMEKRICLILKIQKVRSF